MTTVELAIAAAAVLGALVSLINLLAVPVGLVLWVRRTVDREIAQALEHAAQLYARREEVTRIDEHLAGMSRQIDAMSKMLQRLYDSLMQKGQGP